MCLSKRTGYSKKEKAGLQTRLFNFLLKESSLLGVVKFKINR